MQGRHAADHSMVLVPTAQACLHRGPALPTHSSIPSCANSGFTLAITVSMISWYLSTVRPAMSLFGAAMLRQALPARTEAAWCLQCFRE